MFIHPQRSGGRGMLVHVEEGWGVEVVSVDITSGSRQFRPGVGVGIPEPSYFLVIHLNSLSLAFPYDVIDKISQDRLEFVRVREPDNMLSSIDELKA